ncbi:MAG: alpha-1,2-fucosyltransferase [Clostridiales bacterium]|nr:alpha-1,2-fucosyltransferase [Clostridiales bacterium]MDU6975018.1 alpha-1,2-fucosyltransferase [Clostridiales bacterium]
MIFIEVIGGLGNQMFQYALYEKLKRCYGKDEVRLHIGRFKEIRDNNGYELERVFSVKEGEDFSPIVMQLIDDKMDLFTRVRRKLFGFKRSYFMEGEDLSFKKNILSLKLDKDIYLRGLWQSEYYFKDIRQELLNIFEFESIEDDENKRILDLMRKSNSVSIHIRRGDYINNSIYQEMLGGVCDTNYYNQAIAKIEEIIDAPHFFVFSDDINWARESLPILRQHMVEYIDWNKGLKSHIDMQLMSCCKNNIIANSTFSWWGAWLNQNENKVVIAPKIWFKTKKVNRDIIPKEWIKI